MQIQIRQLYEFGPFRLDVNERLLMRGGRVVPLSPKIFDTLLVLVENSGRIMGKDELMQTIWPDTFVEESNLTHNISQIRRALGSDEYIETIPRRGYRFVFQVQTVRHEAPDEGTAEIGNGAGKDLFKPANGAGPSNGVIASGAQSMIPEPTVEEAQPDVVAVPVAFDPKRLKMPAALFLVGLALLTMTLFVIFRPANNHAGTAFRQVKMARLTTSGKTLQAAVSRDGKYLAYVEQDGDLQCLWIRQVAETGGAQVVAPAEMVFNGLTFAPDDSFIYYVARLKGEPTGKLYQIPVLGGISKQLMSGVDSPVTLSPDGQSLAFVRNYSEQREVSLMTAGLDGEHERRLITRKSPETISTMGPSWSPDGKVIACAAGLIEGLESTMHVLAVNVTDGSAAPIGNRTWSFAGQVAWLGDGSGVLFQAWRRSSAVYGDPLWLLSYPQGEARQITNDLTNHESVSISADSATLIARSMDRISRIWIAPSSAAGIDTNQATQLQSGFGDNFSEWFGLDWTLDGRLIYGSQSSGNLEIWTSTADGQQRQLTRDAPTDIMPVVSADGRYIVFVSDRSGRSNIWRMGIDGGNPKQVTHGRGDLFPDLSPDGQWVVYSSWNSGEPALWKSSIDGGEPVQLVQNLNVRPVISPDGKWIAYFYRDERKNKGGITLLPFAGGEPQELKDQGSPDFGLIRWSPDSRALTYIVTQRGVSNIWSQPIDGGPAKQLTNFNTDRIFRFAWARDGKHLAYERGMDIKDVVLISSGK